MIATCRFLLLNLVFHWLQVVCVYGFSPVGSVVSKQESYSKILNKNQNAKLRESLSHEVATTTRTSMLSAGQSARMDMENNEPDSPVDSVVHVVVFGLGDLRTDDHGGLHAAVEAAAQSGNQNESLFLVCHLTKDMLSRFPGAVCYTYDTALMIGHALNDLQSCLKDSLGKDAILHVTSDDDSLMDLCESLRTINCSEGKAHSRLCLHACDLGPADNDMRYGVLRAAADCIAELNKNYKESGNVEEEKIAELKPWANNLRQLPWTHVRRADLVGQLKFPQDFTTYEKRYLLRPIDEVRTNAVEVSSTHFDIKSLPDWSLERQQESWTEQALLNRLQSACRYATNDSPASVKQRVLTERSSGLYGTHWGGLPAYTVTCSAVLKTLQLYLQECEQDDNAWSKHSGYIGKMYTPNGKSLEHAAMQWQLAGNRKSFFGNLQNWMAGESMVRYLAAPLLLGSVSPRRIWRMTSETAAPSLRDIVLGIRSKPLRQMVEAREWHRLLAARNMLHDPTYQGKGVTTFRYWRYHGFLCRYALTDMSVSSTNNQKEGFLMIHGFGASGAQWNKMMKNLCDDAKTHKVNQGLAPDLLGFGQSEKPALSYTGYMWDSFVMDFVKERAIHEHGWTSLVIGGNSIGGFTSLSFAASDTASIWSPAVTSSGAPGTGLCTGVILLNSAGPVQTKDEVIAIARKAKKKLQLESVAQATILNALPPCLPPARPVARVFGNTLLANLRPRIQPICKNLYPTNPAAVDKELCDAILRDSIDPGAVYVMMSGAKLPPPRTANELLQSDFGSAPTANGHVTESSFSGPVLIAQGVLDPLNDATDRMKRFAALRQDITAVSIRAGHCPHDELPDVVAQTIIKWMSTTKSKRLQMLEANPEYTVADSQLQQV